MKPEVANVLLRCIRKPGGTRQEEQTSDGELLERFVGQRDEAAFTVLVSRHGPMVLRVAQGVLGNAHDAADVFQATFLMLVHKARSIRKAAAVSCWLYGVAHRLALRMKTRAAREQVRVIAPAARPEADPLETLTVRELFAALDEELQRLPEKYRAALLLCHLGEKTQDEAARQLAWPLATLRHRLKRGRELLGARLLRRGLTLSALALPAGLAAAVSPVPVSDELLCRTIRTVLDCRSGPAVGRVPARVRALVEEYAHISGTGAVKLKGVLALGSVLGLLAVAAAWTLCAEALLPPPPRTARPGPNLDRHRRVDSQGDPLPSGVMTRLGTVRLRHAGPATAVAYSPDRAWLASGGDDQMVRLWQPATGKELHRFGGHVQGVRCVGFSPDGKVLASGSGGGVIRLWDLATFKERRPFRGHQSERIFKDWGGLYALAFSPDGKTLASSSHHDLAIYLWDVKTGRERRLPEPACGTALLAFSPDGKTLATAEREALRLWDVAAGKLLSSVRTGNDTVSLSFANQGKTLVLTTYRGTVYLRDTATLKEHRKLKATQAGIPSAVLSPDGKTLAVAAPDCTIRLWDIAAAKQLRCLRGHRHEVLQMVFAPRRQDPGLGKLRSYGPSLGRGHRQESAAPPGSSRGRPLDCLHSRRHKGSLVRQ